MLRTRLVAFAFMLVVPVSAALASDGQAIYEKTCKMCHNAGVAGAPKFGDKAAWAPRLAKGVAVLEKSALDGIGVMPAKGGNKKLSDDEVKAAVAYLVNSAK